MKLLLFVWIYTISCTAFCQSRKYTVHFAKDGKLADIQLNEVSKHPITPAVSSFPTVLFEGELLMDLSAVEVKDSRYHEKLVELDKVLSASKIPLIQKLKTSVASDLTSLLRGYSATTHGFKYNAANINLPFNLVLKSSVKTLKCINCPGFVTSIPGQLQFKPSTKINNIDYAVQLEEFDNEILSEHLKSTNALYKGIGLIHENYLTGIRRKFQNEVNLIDEQFVSDSLGYKYYNIDLIRDIIRLQPQIKQINKIYDFVLEANEPWLLAWMWYTGGVIQLNPFNVSNDTILIRSRLDAQIFELEEELKTWHTLVAHDKADFEIVNKKITIVSSAIARLRRQRENSVTLSSKYKAWNEQVSKREKLLYSGNWQISSQDSIHWMHHFDAAGDYRYLSQKDSLPDKLSEFDNVVIEVHNVAEKVKIKVTPSLANFQPKSPLEITLKEIEDSFAGNVAGAKNLSKLLGNIIPASLSQISQSNILETSKRARYSVIKNKGRAMVVLAPPATVICRENIRKALENLKFDNPDKVAIIGGLIDKCLGTEYNNNLRDLVYANRAEFVLRLFQNFDIKAVEDYKIVINELDEVSSKLEWLLTQTKPILKIELKADETADFRTVTEFPEEKLEIEDSKEVIYSLFVNDEKEPELTKKYKKYKQTRFLPTIGLAFIPENRTGTTFDEATGQFTSGKRFDNIEALVGVKYYFLSKKRTNPVQHIPTTRLIHNRISGDANLRRGNTVEHRFFVTGGLGVRHQFLRNYYLGAGGDIIPGINAHLGANFIFQRRYNLENGKILNEQERPRPYLYFAISFDPGIVASLTKIFIN
jgi:hypothetical protein